MKHLNNLKKQNTMNAQQLKNFLTQLESDGNNLNDIEVYFRYNYDSDVVPLRYINEDLFDETGTILKSICIMNREDEGEDELKIVIEDYYGNTMMETSTSLSKEILVDMMLGNFSVADFDINENDEEYVRLQYDYEGHVPEKELKELVKILN